MKQPEASQRPAAVVDFEALAEQFGTPLYVYDMDAAVVQLAALAQHIPERIRIYYAIKANPNARVLQILRDHVAGVDISSLGELRLALAAGFERSTISFAGPGKSDMELRAALDERIQLVSVESRAELRRLAGLARARRHKAPIALRVNPSAVPDGFAMRMGGGPSQFGIAEEMIDEVIEEAMGLPMIDLQGIHVYAGTQCLDLEAIVASLQQTLEMSRRLAVVHDLAPMVVNLGGGFGVPYFDGQLPLDSTELATKVAQLVNAFVDSEVRFRATRFIIELGRYLIGPFGTYVARVVEVKQVRGKQLAIIDGGLNHCLAATGNLGQLVKKNYPVHNLSHPKRECERYDLVGPLCTPLDAMARGVKLPVVEVGDLIAFEMCGAYGFTASPLLFLGHDTPPEIVHFRGRCELARGRMLVTQFT